MDRERGPMCLCGHDGIVHKKIGEERKGACNAYTCRRDGVCEKFLAQLPGSYRPWPKYNPKRAKVIRQARKINREIWHGTKA